MSRQELGPLRADVITLPKVDNRSTITYKAASLEVDNSNIGNEKVN